MEETPNTTATAPETAQPLVRPCPLLFPSFTVTEETTDEYGRIARAVAADTYLPPGYRSKAESPRPEGKADGCGAKVRAAVAAYISAAKERRKRENDESGKFSRRRIRRICRATGETVEYPTAAKAATFNSRSVETLYRQIRAGDWKYCRYAFEVIDDETA